MLLYFHTMTVISLAVLGGASILFLAGQLIYDLAYIANYDTHWLSLLGWIGRRMSVLFLIIATLVAAAQLKQEWFP